jgi:hypothetical protein
MGMVAWRNYALFKNKLEIRNDVSRKDNKAEAWLAGTCEAVGQRIVRLSDAWLIERRLPQV